MIESDLVTEDTPTPPPDGSAPVAVDAVRDWARRLYADAPGWVAVCAFPSRRHRHVEAADADGVAAAVAELGDRDQDVYLSAPTLHTVPPSGRGGAAHAGALVDVWADVDIAGPTHKDSDGLPADVEGAHAIIDQIPVAPTVVVHSGGGLQPRWAFHTPWVLDTDEDRDEALSFLRSWGAVVTAAAERAGYHVDGGVWDLARLLRAPGTWNRKALHLGTGDRALPIVVHRDRGSGYRYTRDHLARHFLPEPTDHPHPPPSPARRDDGWSAAEWVNDHVSWDELLADWTRGTTDGEGRTYWTRPGKNPRAGHSATTRDVPPVLVNFSDADAAGLPVGKGHKLTKFRVYAHRFHGGDQSAAARAVYERHGPPKVNGARLVDAPDATLPERARRTVRLTPASAITPKPVRWTWDRRLPVGELCLTPGRGGIGKSTFAAWIIARLTRGELPGVHLGVPRACVVAAVEDSWERTIVPRLIAAGAKLDRVFRADVITDDGEQVTLTLPADTASLEDGIRDVGAVLVSVDPLMSAVSAGLDTHKDRDVRQALEPLAQLADRTGATILGNAHFRKGVAADPLMMAMGSAAFGNVVRAALGFARDVDEDGKALADGSCVITQIKNNLGRTDLPSLRYRIDSTLIDTNDGKADVGQLVMVGETDRTVDAIFTTKPTGTTDRGALDQAADWLDDVLSDVADEGMTRKEVLKLGKAEGHTERTLERAAEHLRVVTQRDDSARGRPSTWYHPDYAPTADSDEPLASNPQAADQHKHQPAFDYAPGDTPWRETKSADSTDVVTPTDVDGCTCPCHVTERDHNGHPCPGCDREGAA